MLKKTLFKILKNKKEVFPRLLSIELSSSCNAKCIMCPHSSLMTRPKKNIDPEILNKVIDDCVGKPLKKINLFWFGDSLCNKHIIEHIRKIRSKLPQVKLILSTNAELLSAERTHQIIDEKLIDVINFDIDGVTEETHFEIRKIKLEPVEKNVNYFLDYQKKSGKNSIETRVTFIKMTKNQHETDDFIKKWSSKVDKVDVNKYNTWLGDITDLNVLEEKNDSPPISTHFDFACIHPWDELVISSEGTAGLCCLDYDLKAPLGDVMKESIQEIWQGKRMNQYRTLLLQGKYDKINVCKKCNAHIFQQKSTWRKLQI